ncbi:MAG: hypothetical protein K1X29_01890 [Bdellovibrionales bacterium]|nr:hypothetical protein [Bdellovibrionales bacterium]
MIRKKIVSKKYINIFILGFIFFIPFQSFSETSVTLNNLQIYQRCSAKLTRNTPPDNDPFLAEINRNQKTGVQACQDLLNLGMFESTTKQISTFNNDSIKRDLAIKVVSSMHDLHSTWIHNKKFSFFDPCIESVTNSVVDPQESVLFFTKALFDSTFGYNLVVTSTSNLRAIREVPNPTKSVFSPRITDAKLNVTSTSQVSYNFTPNGLLYGVGPGNSMNLTLTKAKDPKKQLTNQDPLKNLGGGILGTQAYLLSNYSNNIGLVPNLLSMPRSWSKYLFEDLLCRKLPVIYERDATAFIDNQASALPFRKQATCIQCHATMDQVGGILRNFSHYWSAAGCTLTNTPKVFNASFLIPENKTSSLTTWNSTQYDNYSNTKPYGKFYFRDYKGTLVNRTIQSFSDLGSVIEDTDDFYICAAKRYYQYFTGINVEIEPMTPDQVNNLSANKKFYRDRVVNLGIDLKNKHNKRTNELIKAIFDLPEYKLKDFKLNSF